MSRDDPPALQPELFAQLVPAAELTTADWQLLLLADSAGPAFNSLPAERIALELARGEMFCFRLRPQPGLLLVEVRVGATGLRRLGVVRTAGRGLGWMARELAQLLQHLAREWGCQQVETVVYNARLAKAMKRVGAEAESVNMVLEVGDGN